MDPAFMRMLQIRDTMRQTGARPDTPQMLEGRANMGTPLEALPGDESFGQLGEARPFEATDEMKAELGQTTQLQQVQQAVNQMQENQQALADHLGAGSRMANNQRQLGLLGLMQGRAQPSRLTNVVLQETLGPKSLMRSI